MATITLRSAKGSPLTNAEVDGNFSALNNELATAVKTIASADGSVTISGTTAIDLSVVKAANASNLLVPVRNATGATLTKGTAVYISGATGQISTVTKAIASSDATSAQTLGLIADDLPNNTNGNVVLIGTITNINTSAYSDGQQLYLSPTTAGALTATKPYAPNHLVYIAVVEHSHITQGKLFVKVQNGYEMDELHDVSAQSPANNDGLFYNTSTSLWEKKSIATALGYTPYNASNPAGYTTNVGTVTSVSGTGTVSGLTLSGSVTSSGSLTLGGTLSLTSGNVTTALGYTPANKAGDTFTGNVLVNSGADSRVQVQSNGTTVVQLQATASEARLHGVGAIPVSLWSNGVKIIEASTSQVTINNRPLVSTNTITGSQFNGSAAGLTGIKTVNGTSILGSGNIPVGVTQIVAGTNVTISPVGGTGIVTINASGGGGGGSPATPAVAGIVYGRTNNNTCSPTFATSLGFQAGAICQGSNSIAIGGYAGLSYQSCSAVAVGSQAGNWQQNWAAVAVGPYAGNCLQGAGSIAIGNQAGFVTQGCTAVAIGFNAGSYSQLADAVAIGSSAGNFNQGYQAVAIGSGAGVCLQSSRAVAIGHAAGGVSQGVNSVAIGAYAGDISMPANSIAINATGASLTPTGVSQTHMAPIRNATTAYHLYYDPTTKEITYG